MVPLKRSMLTLAMVAVGYPVCMPIRPVNARSAVHAQLYGSLSFTSVYDKLCKVC
jgi:hypothetical protein